MALTALSAPASIYIYTGWAAIFGTAFEPFRHPHAAKIGRKRHAPGRPVHLL